MNIADLKRLRDLTGASFAECKTALDSCATMEEAELRARELVAAREADETADEAQRLKAQRESSRERLAAEAGEAFVKSLKVSFGLTPEEVQRLLDEEGGNQERVRTRAQEIRRERSRKRMLERAAELDRSGFSLETSFRSDLTLCGASKVIVGFEPVEGSPVEFRLDLHDGVIDRMCGWSEHVVMPGQSPDDPEPLGAWWIISADRRMHISLQASSLDYLAINDLMVKGSDHPEVEALLNQLTNVTLRDLWISS